MSSFMGNPLRTLENRNVGIDEREFLLGMIQSFPSNMESTYRQLARNDFRPFFYRSCAASSSATRSGRIPCRNAACTITGMSPAS